MKEGWEYKKLGNICNILNGFAFKSSTYVAEGIRVIRISNVQKGIVEDKDPKFFPLSCKREIENYLLNEGDLLISLTGNVGRVGLLYKELLPAALNQRVACLRLKDENIKKQYLFHFLNSNYFEDICIKNSKGAAQLNMSTVWLSNYAIPIPSLSEQQSIVDYLDSAFAKIDAMKANTEKALNEAKALFHASLKEMLEPKEGWEEKKLGDICSDIRYGTSTPSNENGEYKYLRMNNITNDGFLDVSHYKTISLPEKELEKCLVKRGDIIFNRTNSRELVGKSCVFTENENMVIAGYLIRIRLKEGFEPQFITYSMNLQRSLGLFQHLIVGAVHQANISANNIQKVIINYPPLSEQQSIVATLDSLKSKVDRLQENFDKISQECDALKQAILRQVFE